MHALQTKTFSPKELAQVVGVSESSIKRWVDAGLIGVTRTAGGHRRIVLSQALRFIREQDMRVLRPELLGLPDLKAIPPEARDEALTGTLLFELLERGDMAKVRGLLAIHYLDGTSIADLCDGPVAEALHRIGELWVDGEHGIYVEHWATHVCIEALNQIRLLIPPPEEGAPVAVGAAPEADPYMLPSLMATTVLADAGYAVVNLGPQTPAAALAHAVEEHRPVLAWLAVTSTLSPEILSELVALAVGLKRDGVDVVVGGREAASVRWPSAVRLLDTMNALARYAEDRQVAHRSSKE